MWKYQFNHLSDFDAPVITATGKTNGMHSPPPTKMGKEVKNFGEKLVGEG